MVIDPCPYLLVEEGYVALAVSEERGDERRCVGEEHQATLELEALQGIIDIDEYAVEPRIAKDLASRHVDRCLTDTMGSEVREGSAELLDDGAKACLQSTG